MSALQDPSVMDPAECRRVRVRARRQALSAEQRALINQRRREAYHARKPSAGVVDPKKKAKWIGINVTMKPTMQKCKSSRCQL
jgi:hypothetical protein